MDFAIIKTGGKQYKVSEGDKLKIEKIAKDKGKVEFDDILAGKKVIAEIIAQGRHQKVRILKFHPKKRYKRITGHHQPFTEIRIEKIKNA